jgi:hypothetical protein
MKGLFLDKSGKVKLILIIVLVFSLVSTTLFSSAFVNQEIYNLGDELRIDLRNEENYSVKIATPSKTLLREGRGGVFLYSLEEIGVYSISFKFQDRKESYSFEVVDDKNSIENENYLLFEESFIQEGFLESNRNLHLEKINSSLYYKIKLGENVSWREKYFVDSSEELKVKIPDYASNISVFSKDGEIGFEEKLDSLASIKKFLSINVEKEIVISSDSGEVEIEYFTPAPVKNEKVRIGNKKEVVISSPDDVHYEDVLAYTYVDEKIKLGEKNLIEVYWVEEDRHLDFEAFDLNGNGFVDYIEWVVPHLSTQTFEIILIVDAVHLDSERNFIENIFQEVYEKDDVWKLIPNGDFVRVSFEKNLTNENDITVYATSNFSNARIEVYEKNSYIKIADILGISSEGYYKTFLTNLVGTQDTFDLRMIGDILIDLIIDPTVIGSCTSIISCLDNGATTTCTCSEVDSSNNVYAGGGLSTKSANLAEVVINISNSSLIPTGSLISDAELSVEFSVDTGMSTCTIDYNIAGGSWVSLDSDCTDETTETTLSFDLSSLTESQLESLSVRVNAVKNSNRGAPILLNVDYVFLNVTYAEVGGDLFVELNSPENNHETSNETVQFEFFPSSSTGDFTNCSYWDDSTGVFLQNQTNSSSIVNASTNSFTQSFFSDGSYLWNVQCCDATNGCFFAPLNRTITVDTVSPVVSLVFPENNSVSTSLYGVDFFYNVTDSRGVEECSLIIDGSSVLTDYSITKNVNQTISYPVSSGIHTWAISCLDAAGNQGYSENRTINVSFTPQTYDRRWYETSTSDYTSTADIYLSNTRDGTSNGVTYSVPGGSLYTLSEAISPFMGNNGALIDSGTVSFSGYFTTSRNNQIYITWKVYVTNTTGDTLICQSGDDSTTGTRLTGSGTFTGSCTNPSDLYLYDTDRIKLVVNAWNDFGSPVDVGHYWDDLYLSYVEFNTFSSLGDLSVDMTSPINDLSINTDDEFNMTCFINCSIGDCLNTNVYAQYNTSSMGWTNIGSSGNLILASGETNPYSFGTLNSSGGYVNFTIEGNLASVNNIRCIAESTYSNSVGETTKQVTVSGVNQAPYVDLVHPENNSWVNLSSFDFTYYVNDVDDDLAYCELYIDGVYNQTNSSTITDGANNNFSISGLSQGEHNWSVNCTDAGSKSNSSNTWIFYVDTYFPQIDLIYPEIDGVLGSNDVEFNFSVLDNLDSSLTCNLTIDGLVEDESFEAVNGSYTNRTIFDLSVGDHLWNVSCIDEAGNLNTSETRNFTIGDSNPIVNLIYPENDSWVNTTNPILIYNVSENNDLAYCDLYIDGIFNQSNSSLLINNGENNFSVLGLTQGEHNWHVNCTDDAGLTGISDTWVFYVDSIFPQINLNLPVDYFNSTEGDTNFNFTVIDNLDSSLICNLTINSVAVDSNFNVVNNTLTNRFFEDVGDGLNYWNVSCVDEAGNLNTSETRILNVTEYPSLILDTEDNAAFNYTPFNLSYIPDDNGDFQSCELYLNGVLNQTNSTPISKGFSNYFEISTSSGYYNWSVECTDSFGLVNQSENRSFLVDFVSPNVESFYPEDGGIIYSSIVEFNFSVTDDYDTNIYCGLNVDGSIVNSSYFSNDSIGVLSWMFSSGGLKSWNITCNDSAGNTNTTQTKTFTLYTPPIINLLSPIQEEWINQDTITFIYNISDGNDDLKNASLFLDGVLNQTNSSSLVNWGENNFTVSGIIEGIHNWTVEVYDNENLLGTETPLTFYVDKTAPNVTINYPSQDEVVTTNNISLNFSITDNLDTEFVCNISVDYFNEFEEEVFSLGENVRYLLRGDGNYSWFVECSDSAGNNFKTEENNFSVVAPPNVTLNFPEENYLTNLSTLTFNYTPEDAIGITSCTLFVDGVENETDTDIERNLPNYFTYTGITEGVHNWTVGCVDADSNFYAPSPINFIRDISPPEIILNYPYDNSSIDASSGSITFSWTAIDEFDDFFYCNLYVDGNLEAENKFVENNSLSSEAVTGIGLGEHTWNVTCWDELNNINTSATWSFNYSYSDFFIDSDEIYFNSTDPKENEPINISATIRNIGSADSTNVLVQFYLGHPFFGGEQIGNNQSIDINWSQAINISQIFYPEIGPSEIYVIIDQYDEKMEINESNNIGNKNISVGAWQFFYGHINSYSNYTLKQESGEELIDWSVNFYEGGSVFVADVDSSISWPNVLAIGKNTLGEDSNLDISEIDILLSMDGLADSLSNLFLGEETSFSVFNRFIDSVPITNSTNNTNFVTGVLWDSSDTVSNNEFDSTEKEDLIFVSKIEKNLVGAYGTYDYEMRVPANLRSYSGSSSSSVAFYMELY